MLLTCFGELPVVCAEIRPKPKKHHLLVSFSNINIQIMYSAKLELVVGLSRMHVQRDVYSSESSPGEH